MRLGIDAGVAVKWLVAEEGSDTADRLLTNGDDLYAPRLMASKIANALWRKVRLGETEHGRAGVPMAAVSERPVRQGADGMVCADAVRLASALERPVYDGRARRYGDDAGGSCAGGKLTRPSSHVRASAAFAPAQSTMSPCLGRRSRST